jgi:hypothetical protein
MGFGAYCGFAWIETDDTTSAITDALLRLKLARNVTGHAYHVEALGNVEHSPSMDYNELLARAAAESLTGELGQGFYMHSRPD